MTGRGRTSSICAALALTLAACSGETTAPATSASLPSGSTTTSGTRPASSAPTDEPTSEGGVTPLPGLLDASDAPIDDDPEATSGVLENGLEYFVRHNDQPGAKASLRLVVKAGSADELGPETGVAHFLEHMLFNGTEQYPENELIDVLRGFGAEFGPDVNAYTSYDETVYELEVPAGADSVEAAIDVLHEWLTAASIDAAQVTAERGVVLDEWRSSTQTVEGRLFELAAEHYLAGTRYAGRDPIGTAASIEGMQPETLRTFYDAWYRPDNAAVVVVGDVDVDETVALIADVFGTTEPRVGSPNERTEYEFTPFREPAFVLHADPDQTTVDVEVTLPIAAIDGHGTAALRARLLDQIVFDVLVRRLARDAAGGDAAFDQVLPGTNTFVEGLDAPALYAITDADRADDALVALLDEYERAYRFGFEPAEVEVAVEAARATYDTLYGPDGESQDWELADLFVNRFLTGAAAPARAVMHALITAELANVTPEALAERFAARYTNTAPQVIISTPASQADDVPDEAAVLAAIAGAPGRDLAAREPAGQVPELLMERPDPVEPTEQRSMSDDGWDLFDPVEYTYPNGARVVLLPNDIARGEVYLQASSPGGLATVDPDDVVDGLFAAEVMGASGAAGLGPADLAQVLSRYDVELEPDLNTYYEGWWGRAASTDVEQLLALVHARMTAAEPDPVILRQTIQRYQPIVDDPSTDPDLAGTDALNAARYGDSPYYDVLPDPEEFATLDADGIGRVWRDRYGDASDFVFVLAGDFDRDEVRGLADAYVGTLPGGRGVETPSDVTPPPPDAPVSVPVQAGAGATAYVEMLFTSPAERLHPADDAVAAVAASVIDARLTRVVREEFGDSYSPFSQVWTDEDPDPVVLTYVYASGAPERVAAIGATIRAELADLATGGLTEAEFATAKAPVVEAYEYVDNGEFLTHVMRAVWDPDYDLTEYVYKYDAVATVTRADVVAFLAEHVPAGAYAEAIVTPR